MVLADTSVWIEHFRVGEPTLQDLLSEGLVLMHPFVLGELVCGNLKDRAVIIAHLQSLPSAHLAFNDEVMKLVEDARLWGKGLGWTDVHLLASALLTHCRLWTRDVRLGKIASELKLC